MKELVYWEEHLILGLGEDSVMLAENATQRTLGM